MTPAPSRLWTVLAHPWHECYLDVVPFLAEGGDTVRDVKPHMWEPATDRPEIVLGLAQAWKICPNVRRRAALAQNVIPYETENLLAPGGHRRASEVCRQALRPQLWLNYSRANARVFGDIPLPPRNGGPGRLYRHDLAAQMPGPIDVFFAGSINRRRANVLEQLVEAGCVVDVVGTQAPLWGDALEARMARAKVVLNLHYYDPGVFEVFRVAPAVARGHIVISEADPAGEGHDWCRCVPYKNLVGEVLYALGRGPATVP